MKALILALGVAGIVALAGCSDGGGSGGGISSVGGGGGANMQSLVLDGCSGGATNDNPADINNGQPWLEDANSDPNQSTYTRSCLGGED